MRGRCVKRRWIEARCEPNTARSMGRRTRHRKRPHSIERCGAPATDRPKSVDDQFSVPETHRSPPAWASATAILAGGPCDVDQTDRSDRERTRSKPSPRTIMISARALLECDPPGVASGDCSGARRQSLWLRRSQPHHTRGSARGSKTACRVTATAPNVCSCPW
jgi:hypothetical protein